MTFEDAISALGTELGFDLPVKEGEVRLDVSSSTEDEEPLTVSISEMQGLDGVLLSAEIGDVSTVKDLMPLLKANHGFSDTAGATLSIGDGLVYFEHFIPYSAIVRGEGEQIVKAFASYAIEWRSRLVDMEYLDAGVGAVPDAMQSSFRV